MVAHAKYAQSNISASATYLLWLPLAYMHCLIVVLDGLICRGSSLFCNLHCDWLIASTKAAASGSPRHPQVWAGSECKSRVLLPCPDVLAQPAFWLV